MIQKRLFHFRLQNVHLYFIDFRENADLFTRAPKRLSNLRPPWPPISVVHNLSSEASILLHGKEQLRILRNLKVHCPVQNDRNCYLFRAT
jgi:hypothetical protein